MDSRIDNLLAMLEDCPPEDEEINDCLDQFANTVIGVSISSGETRYAVIFKGLDFVLKIPRYGYCDEDYCEVELHNYEVAKRYRIEKVLLPIEYYYTTSSGIVIYKQPKYSFSTSEGEYNKNYRIYLAKRNTPIKANVVKRIVSNCYDGYRIDNKWMARVLQLYGKKFCRSFEAWSQECHVNDLHNSNTGWLDNKPIILDYGGFRG